MISDENTIMLDNAQRRETQIKNPLLKRKHNAKVHIAGEVDTSGNDEGDCMTTHHRIAERAFEIYKQSGFIQGRSETNWFQAEIEFNNRKQ